MVVEIGKHELGAVGLFLDTAPPQRRPQNEGHDFVRVAHQSHQQPSTDRHDRCRHQGDAQVMVVSKRQFPRQGEADPNDQPGRRRDHEEQMQIGLTSAMANVQHQREEVRTEPHGQHCRPAPREPHHPEEQPRREQEHAAGDRPHRDPRRSALTRDVGEQEHRPELLGHTDVGEPEPGEQPDDRVGQNHVTVQIKPVPPAIDHVDNPVTGGHHESAHGEAQSRHRGPLATRRQRREDVHYQ